jgi:type I restriction enzyme S subunit
MSTGWQTVTLSDLFDITSSKRVFEADWTKSGTPFYRAREIVKLARDGYVQNELFISDSMYEEYTKKYGKPNPGDIMVTGVGTLGICYVVQEKDRFYFKDGNIIWLRKKANSVDSNYIAYAFQSDLLRAQIDNSVGATVGTYTIIKANGTRVPLPPLPEQQRVVAILDEAFEAIATAKANTEKNLQNARTLFESHLQSVFTNGRGAWREKPLDQLCDPARSITYGVIKLGDETPNGTPCLRTSNVRWLRIDTSGMKRIAPSLSEEYSRTVLQGGEVLVNVRGTLGGVAVVPPEMSGWNISREVALVPVDPKTVHAEFLVYFIGSAVSQEWLSSKKKGAAYVGINLEDLRLLPVALPEMGEQLEIIRHLDEIRDEVERLAAIYIKKLHELATLKAALLHQAFTGNL